MNSLTDIFLAVILLLSPHSAFAISPLVISQVQISQTSSSNSEFVELYNSSDFDVDLSGYSLKRKTSSGTTSNLVSSISGAIKSKGYFLIAHPDWPATVIPDQLYSATSSGIASNNTIILFDKTNQAIDKVGLGTALDFEGNTATNPPNNNSIIRKSTAVSTIESLSQGGSEEFNGNGYDSDDNSFDFLLTENPYPKNTSFSIPSITPTPTPTVTVTPTPTPTSTPSTTPTPSPEMTPTPVPTTTPTTTPAPTPTDSITPTPTPDPTPTPTVLGDQKTHHWAQIHFHHKVQKYINTCKKIIEKGFSFTHFFKKRR